MEQKMIQVTEYEKLDRGRICVCFDNESKLILYPSEAKQARLREAGYISEADYERLLNEVVGKRAVRRAMHLLERTDQTEYQLREKLEMGGYPSECIDKAVAYVQRFHYLDDLRYACNYVRLSKEKHSRQNIRLKLMQKGVEKDTVERAIEEEYDASEAVQIRKLLARKNYNPDTCDEKEFRRIYQYLMRKGFRGSDVLREMRSDWQM